MPAMENMEINAEATTAKDGAKTENMAINAEAATTAKGGAKTEANRKKKERQKAKARAEKAAAAAGMAIPGVLPSAEAVAAGAANAPQKLSERRHAGEDRGLGMFATEAIQCGRCIASATPALSVVFDESADEVCGFCFKCEEPSQIEEAVVLQRTANGFGLILDDRRSWTGGAALIAGVVKGGANSGVVFTGDRIVSIDGAPVVGGHEGAIGQLRAACERLGEGAGVPAVLSRPSRVQCQGCGKFCACASCVKAGRLEWHAHECRAFQALPAGVKGDGPAAAGGALTKAVDTSVLRLLLRFRVTLQPEVGEWSADKESTTALTSLQRNPVNLDRSQLATLASLTGITSNDAGALISMVRTNACQVERNGKKAGCALSALVGWHNHDCTPNAAATVMADGRLSICALRDIDLGKEVLISYIDVSDGREARRNVLSTHYGFECRCDRCKLEQRASLKSALKQSQDRRR